MKTLGSWSPAPYLTVTAVEREELRWFVMAYSRERACCPVCGVPSLSRHSFYSRTLWRSFRSGDTGYDPGARGSLALPERAVRLPDLCRTSSRNCSTFCASDRPLGGNRQTVRS
jgi:hypothetical protein